MAGEFAFLSLNFTSNWRGMDITALSCFSCDQTDERYSINLLNCIASSLVDCNSKRIGHVCEQREPY